MAYTTIDDPSAHFQTTLYTGSGSPQDITNGGNSDLQPDMVWIKLRDSNNGAPHISDSTRGVSTNTGKYVRSDSSAAESDDSNGIRAFNTDGFKTGDGWFNGASSSPYVAWQWKANGGTTSSNTDGDITTTVQVNQTAGFSIMTYTGNGSNNQTLGHGLNAVPKMFLFKRRNTTASWIVGFSGNMIGGTSNYLLLNGDQGNSTYNNLFGDSAPSTTLMRVAGDAGVNASGSTYVCYAFAEKQGFSKIGKFVGAGSNSPFIYTGFKPAFVMIKRYDTSNSWGIVDNKRETYNGATKTLFADLLNAESSTYTLDLLSNGFRPNSNHSIFNQSAGQYIFMAFAENPFVTSTGIPTTAR